MSSFVTVVPAIRTIPGVEMFDYAVDSQTTLAPGDVIRVPFRNKTLPAVVLRLSDESAYAEKAIALTEATPLLRLGANAPALLAAAAQRSFTSQPTVCASWLRTVPKRATPSLHAPVSAQLAISQKQTRYAVDRWSGNEGLIQEIQRQQGRCLVLVPWKERADRLAHLLHVPVLHADVSAGVAWNRVQQFTTGEAPVLVCTRLGAWLSVVADAVLIDEPENDDYKSDESSPRLDARWLVEHASILRPELSLISFSTTPRLGTSPKEWERAPRIELHLRTEPWQARNRSAIEGLTSTATEEIQASVERGQRVRILHPISGERARIRCRDCGWSATCASCGFPTSQHGTKTLCKRCGKTTPSFDSCASCGGFDFSRSWPGRERIQAQCRGSFPGAEIEVISFQESALEEDALTKDAPLLLVTDISFLGGGSEDLRRKERLVIAWRRLASYASKQGARLFVQGPEEILADCRTWLTTEGVAHAWNAERSDRRAFQFPPDTRVAKLIVTGPEHAARRLCTDLQQELPQGWTVQGPLSVPFRPHSAPPRWILHVRSPQHAQEHEWIKTLDPFKSRAIIDLDPIAFFM